MSAEDGSPVKMPKKTELATGRVMDQLKGARHARLEDEVRELRAKCGKLEQDYKAMKKKYVCVCVCVCVCVAAAQRTVPFCLPLLAQPPAKEAWWLAVQVQPDPDGAGADYARREGEHCAHEDRAPQIRGEVAGLLLCLSLRVSLAASLGVSLCRCLALSLACSVAGSLCRCLSVGVSFSLSRARGRALAD